MNSLYKKNLIALSMLVALSSVVVSVGASMGPIPTDENGEETVRAITGVASKVFDTTKELGESILNSIKDKDPKDENLNVPRVVNHEESYSKSSLTGTEHLHKKDTSKLPNGQKIETKKTITVTHPGAFKAKASALVTSVAGLPVVRHAIKGGERVLALPGFSHGVRVTKWTASKVADGTVYSAKSMKAHPYVTALAVTAAVVATYFGKQAWDSYTALQQEKIAEWMPQFDKAMHDENPRDAELALAQMPLNKKEKAELSKLVKNLRVALEAGVSLKQQASSKVVSSKPRNFGPDSADKAKDAVNQVVSDLKAKCSEAIQKGELAVLRTLLAGKEEALRIVGQDTDKGNRSLSAAFKSSQKGDTVANTRLANIAGWTARLMSVLS